MSAIGCTDDGGVVGGTGGDPGTTGGSSSGGTSGFGTGGATSTGGTTSAGGSMSTGGASGSGGSSGSGGTTTMGGTSAGGTSGAGGDGAGLGGTAGMSGSTSTGGASGAGGSTGGVGGVDNTGGTAGASGGTAGGGGTSGASSGCSAKLCEGFESGSLDTATWTLSKSGQFTATVGTDQAHSGTHSLHVDAPNTANSAFIKETKTFPASDLWGRAWLRFSGPQGGHQVFIIVASQGDQLRALNRRNGSEAFAVNVQSTDKWYQSATLIPQNTWFCYEWHVTGTATAVYKDGTELSDIKAPGFSGATSLSLGFQRWQTGAEGGIWIDDIAVNDTRVGCN